MADQGFGQNSGIRFSIEHLWVVHWLSKRQCPLSLEECLHYEELRRSRTHRIDYVDCSGPPIVLWSPICSQWLWSLGISWRAICVCSGSALLYLGDHTTTTTTMQVFVCTSSLKALEHVIQEIIATMVYLPYMRLPARGQDTWLFCTTHTNTKKMETTNSAEKHLALERENPAAKDLNRYQVNQRPSVVNYLHLGFITQMSPTDKCIWNSRIYDSAHGVTLSGNFGVKIPNQDTPASKAAEIRLWRLALQRGGL
jgi:hypothetical protein